MTSPSAAELSRMTEKQLRNIEEFVIENEFVKIVFTEPINVLDLDLAGLELEETKISLENIRHSERLNK